jgi:uncharacterized protein DUF6328
MGDESEDPKERLNRKLIELLNELRLTLPGVQVLFAFLLVLPFNQGFEEISELQRYVYSASLVCAAISSMLLIAPSAYHRYRWRTMDKEPLSEKEEMLVTHGRLAGGGIAFLALALVGALFLVFDFLFERIIVAILIAVTMTIGFLWFWYLLPLSRRAKSED